MVRRSGAQFPTLAIVDAFVCAVSIVLILVVVSAPEARDADTQPQADATLRCVAPGDRAVLVGEDGSAPMGLREIFDTIPADRAGERLSLRLRIEATPDLVRCALILRQLAEAANTQRDANRADALGPILLVDIAYLPREPGRSSE